MLSLEELNQKCYLKQSNDYMINQILAQISIYSFQRRISKHMFSSSHFWLLLLATKLRKYYVIFVYILQGKKKKWKENHATKVTKIPKTKR